MLLRQFILFLVGISFAYGLPDVILRVSKISSNRYLLKCLTPLNHSNETRNGNFQWIFRPIHVTVDSQISSSSQRNYEKYSELIVDDTANNYGVYHCVKFSHHLPTVVSNAVHVPMGSNSFDSPDLPVPRPDVFICYFQQDISSETIHRVTNEIVAREATSPCHIVALHSVTLPPHHTHMALICAFTASEKMNVRLAWWKDGRRVSNSVGATSVLLRHPSSTQSAVYQCHTEESLPKKKEEEEVKLKRVPRSTKVLNLRVQSDETSIQVMWSKPTIHGTLKEYRVKWGRIHPGQHTVSVKPSALSYTITDLTPGVRYMIEVVPLWDNGEEERELIEAYTRPKGYKMDLGIPLNLVSDKVSHHSAIVAWDPPTVGDDADIKIEAYRVECSSKTAGGVSTTFNEIRVVNVSGDTTRLQLDSLVAGLTYRYRVQSVYRFTRSFISGNDSELHASHWSLEEQFTTTNKAPEEAPQNISIHMLRSSGTGRVEDKSRAAVRISWQPPRTSRDTVPLPIQQYHIFYSIDPTISNRGRPSNDAKWSKISVEGHELNTVLGSLLPDTYYYLYMTAENVINHSPESSILVCRTTDADGWGGGQVVLPRAYTDLVVLMRDLVQSGEIGRLPRINSLLRPSVPPAIVPSSTTFTVSTVAPNLGGVFSDNAMWFVTAGVLAATLLLVLLIIILLVKCRPGKDTNSNGYKVGNKVPSSEIHCSPPHAMNGRMIAGGVEYASDNPAAAKQRLLMMKPGVMGEGISHSPLLGAGGGVGSNLDADPQHQPYPMGPMRGMQMGALQLPDLFVHTNSFNGAGNMMEMDRRASNSGLNGSSSTEDTPGGGGDLTSISQRHLFTASAYNSPGTNDMLGPAAPYTTTPGPALRRNNALPPGLMHGNMNSPHHQNTLPNNLLGGPLPGQRTPAASHNYYPAPPGQPVNFMGSYGGPMIPSHVPRVNASELAASDVASMYKSGATGNHSPSSEYSALSQATVMLDTSAASNHKSGPGGAGVWPKKSIPAHKSGMPASPPSSLSPSDASYHGNNSTGPRAAGPYDSPIRGGVTPGRGNVTADRGSVLSHSDHEIPKNFSTEELSQEMANLEGLMKDLKAITQKEFEC